MERNVQVQRAKLHAAVALAAVALTAAGGALSCGDEAGMGVPEILSYDGFVGTYFADLTIEEAAVEGAVPELLRLDAHLDFPAARPSFGTEVDSGRYTVRWQGFIWVPEEGVRGLVVTGLGRAGLLIDGQIVFRPDPDGGLIDERHTLSLDRGRWHHIELWYQNLDRNTHAIRLGWMSPNSDLVPIAGGFAGVTAEELPDEPLTVQCAAENVGFQNATLVVDANSVATLHATCINNDVTSDAPMSRLRAELVRLDPDATITATVTATGLDGSVATATCELVTPALPHWVQGHWRAEYFDSSDLTDTAGVRFEPASLAYPSDLPFASNRTEWFPGVGSNTFSMRLSAWMLVEEGGRYRFTAGSDDGTRITVDGVDVVDHWHDSSYDVHEGEVDLGPGYHDLVMEYYQSYGSSAFTWEIARLDGAGRATPIAPETLFGEILEEPEEAPRVSAGIQGELNADDESASQWIAAGCTEGLDLLLNQPARLEIEGDLLLLTLDAPATAHALCILPGTETLAQVRLIDLDGASTDWMRVEFVRPPPEEPAPDGL